ncbi:MAG: hypothetical protein ACFFD8_07395, partial [Candidatus Thorarchaeota archaeon]
MTTVEKFYNRIITSSHVLGPIFSYPLFAIFYYYLWQFSFIITFGNMYNLPWIFGYGSLGFMTSIWIGWYVSLIPVLIVIALNVWVLFRFLVHPPVSLRRLGLVCGIGIGSAFPALLLVGGIVFIFPSLVLNP